MAKRTTIPTPFDVDIPDPKAPDRRRTRPENPPTETHVCALCAEAGAGSQHNGKFYHLSCKLTVKREQR